MKPTALYILFWLLPTATHAVDKLFLKRKADKQAWKKRPKKYKLGFEKCPPQKPDKRDASLFIRPIYRVKNMSLKQFKSLTRNEVSIPFIMENPAFDNSEWTPQSFMDQCGHISVHIEDYLAGCNETVPTTCHRVVEKTPDSKNKWAGLGHADLEKYNISTFGDMLRAQQTDEGAGLYLHDAPLSHYCPPKVDVLKIPKYFPRNYDIINSMEGDKKKGWSDMDLQWPSIFISRKGTGSALHCDSRMTRFWISMLDGAKLWRLIGPSEYWRAAPNYDPRLNELYPHKFHADIINPDFERFPYLDGALVYEAVLKPGDVLYAPAAWAHQVVNAKDSVMTSLNYYDNEVYSAAMDYAEETGDESVVKSAWSAYFMPLDTPEYEEDIPLDEYVRQNHMANAPVPLWIKRWIDTQPAAVVFYMTPDGEPALHGAVRHNFFQLAKYLLEHVPGLDVNQLSEAEGVTALDLALKWSFNSTADLLKRHGANVITRDPTDDLGEEDDSSDDE